MASRASYIMCICCYNAGHEKTIERTTEGSRQGSVSRGIHRFLSNFIMYSTILLFIVTKQLLTTAL